MSDFGHQIIVDNVSAK